MPDMILNRVHLALEQKTTPEPFGLRLRFWSIEHVIEDWLRNRCKSMVCRAPRSASKSFGEYDIGGLSQVES